VNESATPDAVVLLGTDVSGFSAGIDKANAALLRWGEGVMSHVGAVGERMTAAWGKVGEALANPIGTLVLPFKALAVAADGLADLVTAPLRMIPLVGSAAASAIKGIYDAGAAVLGLVPAAVEGVIGAVFKAGEAVQWVADKLGELAEMTSDTLGRTVGTWGGALAEWVSGKLFGPSFAARIGQFVSDELGTALSEILGDELDIADPINAGLAEAVGHANTLAVAFRQIGASVRETQWDFRDTMDDILRDARETVRDIGEIWTGFGVPQLLAEDFREGFEAVEGFAGKAFEQIEGLLGRVLVRAADLIDRAVDRFRTPLATAFDLAQQLLVKIGLIDTGGAKWGDSIRDAASVGEALITKVIGGAAEVAGMMGNLLGGAAKILVDLMEAIKWTAELVQGRTWAGRAVDVIKTPLAIPGAVIGGLGAPETGAEIGMPGVEAWDRLTGRAAAGGSSFANTLGDAQKRLERFADAMGKIDPAKWNADAQAEIGRLIAAQREEAAKRDAKFAEQRAAELEKLMEFDENAFVKPAVPTITDDPGKTARAVLANSQEAANIVARAQVAGQGGKPMEQIAAAAKEQLVQQKKMAAALDKIDRHFERIGTA
jgi:hypothetical protein